MGFSDLTKRTILVAQQSKCNNCKQPLALLDHGRGVAVQYDHIVQKSLGGTNDISNCQALCPGCHHHKTHGDVDQIARKRTLGNLMAEVDLLREEFKRIKNAHDSLQARFADQFPAVEEAEAVEIKLSGPEKILKWAYKQSGGTRTVFELVLPEGIVSAGNNGSSLRYCFKNPSRAGSYPLHLEKVTADGVQLASSTTTKFVRFTDAGLAYAKNL
jgi:hypothetical protein